SSEASSSVGVAPPAQGLSGSCACAGSAQNASRRRRRRIDAGNVPKKKPGDCRAFSSRGRALLGGGLLVLLRLGLLLGLRLGVLLRFLRRGRFRRRVRLRRLGERGDRERGREQRNEQLVHRKILQELWKDPLGTCDE